MLYNLNWLNKGQQFPPICERERIQRYNENRQIFENKHPEVYSKQFKRIDRVLGTMTDWDWGSYPIVLNFQKKISLKTADFLFVEPPVFSAGDENNTNMQLVVDEIVETSDLVDIGYQGAIDCSRYGTAVYKVDTSDENSKSKGKISISSPEYLFTVVSAEDIKTITHYVLAWVYDTTDENGKEVSFLSVRIHEKGKVTKRLYEIKGEVIGSLMEDEETLHTGLDDFAVIPVHNLMTSDSIYGVDDYMDVDSIVSELEIRTAQISKILDVHANPTVSGSVNALTQDAETGEYYFDAGNFYARTSKEDPPLEYITWEASLDANFKQIEKLINYLSVISEMGAAIFEGDMKTGNLPSGSALKRLYINVLAKVARLRNQFDQQLKKAIATASQIGYKQKLEVSDITIAWQDGLPNDPKEEAEVIASRTGSAQTMSTKRVLTDVDGMTDEAAEAEITLIEDEQTARNNNGMTIGPSSGLDDLEDDTDEVDDEE